MKLKKTELKKRYPDADIDYLIMLLEHEMFIKSLEASLVKQINNMISGDDGYVDKLRNIFAKHFKKVENFSLSDLSTKVKFASDLDKLIIKMSNDFSNFFRESIKSTYNYNRQYFLWMLDEKIPELDIYEKPKVEDYVSEMYVGESDEDKKLYDVGYTKEKLEELMLVPRYGKTSTERIELSLSNASMKIKSIFNDAVQPMSNGQGKTYLSVLRKMEKVLKENVAKEMKRAMQFEIQGVSEDVENEVFEINKHLLPTKFQRVEVLDGKTCLVCAKLDGTISKNKVGRIHPNCRGKDVPVLVEGNKVVKSKKKGRPRSKDSFDRWFNKLPKKKKIEVLGKKKYELWEAGDFDLKEFVKGNRTLSLAELEKQKAIQELKDSLSNIDNATMLIDKLKKSLEVTDVSKMTSTSDVTAYEKFLNSKLEIYKAIPNSVLRKNGTDRRTLIAEVKRERNILDLKRQEINLKNAQQKYQDALNQAINNEGR